MPCYLPEIIITNVLLRLPVKSLLRCTSVCRSWYSLITSPQFISSHLDFAAASRIDASLLLRRCIGNSERYVLYSDDESFTRVRALEFPFRSINSCFTIVGSCNGLLCLSDDRVYFTQTVVLWNPSVRKSVLLPKPRLTYNSFGTYIQSLGFGFDFVNGDYKVVRLCYVDCGRSLPQVEIYRLSTGVWEDLSYLELNYFVYNKSRQAFVNGAIHWVASSMDGCDLIVSFDVHNEVFRAMMLPDSLVKSDLVRSNDLMVFRDSIAVVSWNVVVGESSVCVWVMDEYGVEGSWTKLLSFDFGESGMGSVRPLWVRKCGGVVVVSQDGHVNCCNSDGVEVKELGVKGLRSDEYSRTIHVESYVESLVLLKRAVVYAFDEAGGTDCEYASSSGSD